MTDPKPFRFLPPCPVPGRPARGPGLRRLRPGPRLHGPGSDGQRLRQDHAVRPAVQHRL